MNDQEWDIQGRIVYHYLWFKQCSPDTIERMLADVDQKIKEQNRSVDPKEIRDILTSICYDKLFWKAVHEDYSDILPQQVRRLRAALAVHYEEKYLT